MTTDEQLWVLVPRQLTDDMARALCRNVPPAGLWRDVLAAAPQQAPTPAVLPEPYAYAIVIARDSRIELVHDLDDAIDDLTNCECEVIPLYTSEPAAPVDARDALTELWVLIEAYAACLVDCALNASHESARQYLKLAKSNLRAALTRQAAAGEKP